MVEVKKKKPRGKPFPKGVSGNPTGNPPGLVKARAASRTFSQCFIALMNKEVEATEDGKKIKAPTYELFVKQMINAGIKGTSTGTPARKLVLEFMAGLETKETAEEVKKASEPEDMSGFSWDEEKEKLLQQLAEASRNMRV